MPITIGIVKETAAHECRVAATPETVKKFISKGAKLIVQPNAGLAASFRDEDYKSSGATISDDLSSADIILGVQTPIGNFKSGAIIVALMSPYNNSELLKQYASQNITACAIELVPRITRAQAMDVLSSQSNLAGYKAVLDAASQFTRAFPMMMTAAGTIPPARVFVMGAGVAGLQAIATAKRLGAVVSATDVRAASKEQVQSLGGTFVMVESDEVKNAETAGGYAKEMSDDFKQKQAQLIADTITRQDIVITTALIPGKPAPRLITEAMVKSMKTGSVIVDMAVEQGGNCELSKAGEIVEAYGVKIIGYYNIPSRIATDASALYSRNMMNLVNLMITAEQTINLNMEDEIIKSIILTKDGAIIHPNFIQA